MRFIGNVIWFVFAGFWSWLGWMLVGLLACLTIIGIPFGWQCFKIGNFSLFPFGKSIEAGTGFGSLLLNVLWIMTIGWGLAVAHLAMAFVLCLTVIGIPFATQCVKLAAISLVPFGARVYQQY